MSFFTFPSSLFGSPTRENAPLPMNSLAKSPSSPFCTSPSQLQEVTLDQDATFSNQMGLRSPSGPMRGRTVKEFEEQLTNLKKENFNLKLRIYFLEEKMGTNFTLDKDNIVKKNVELQVEIANLQKEVKEKHELLCQAVRAMELEEEEHKKYSNGKDDQLMQLQQEMEDLRIQLQDMKFLSTEVSIKSAISSRQSDMDNIYEYDPEFQSKGRYEDSDSAKQQNQLASFMFDKTDTLKLQIETLHKDCQSKDSTINSLNRELSSANERLIDFAQQVKEYEEKLAQAHSKNESLIGNMQEDQKTMEKLYGQLANLNQKYSVAKYEFEQERRDAEREKKSLERNKMMLDMRNGVLENENKKYKEAIRELQIKLEATTNEAKKNQNLAVSKSRHDNLSNSNNDGNFISVPDAAASDGTPKKDPLHVQISDRKSSKAQAPPTPDNRNLLNFERLLTEGGDSESVLNEFAVIKSEFNIQKQKLVKLKSEQLKACEIIKTMITFRNKANDEIAQLKKAKEEVEKAKEDLEKELENVVSKPQKEKDGVPLRTRLSEMNITAVGTPPCENSNMADETEQIDDLEIVEMYKRLAGELEAKIEVLVETLKEKDSQMQYVQAQYDEILSTLGEKENKIVDLEFELLSVQQNSSQVDRHLLEKGDMGSEKHSSFYKYELEEKNKEIDRLNVELKKCTCYLQEIVNTELWAKNKEIEKMHRKQETTPEVVKLKKELSGKDIQLKMIMEKISELGLDIKLPSEDGLELKNLSSPKRSIQHIQALQDQLKAVKEEKKYFEERVSELEGVIEKWKGRTEPERSDKACTTKKDRKSFDEVIKQLEVSQGIIEKLKSQNNDVRVELETSERLRLETNEVCSVLSNRLEELAIFLDSLLKQKSVLGFLGLAKNKRLREIINNSLDMSRSFTMSLMVNPDQSLAQLTNITTFLNGSVFQELSLAEEMSPEEVTHLSIVPDNISLTYESHLYKKVSCSQPNSEQVITALREQVFNLKSELKLRDNELNRLNSNKESGVEKLTETEGEQQVSKLFTPKSTSATLKAVSEAQSESEAWSEPDREVSKARIGLNHSVPPAFKPSKLLFIESTEDDDIYHSMTPSKRRSAIVELTQDICRLEKELEEKSEEIIVNSRLYRQKLQVLDREVQESKEKLAHAEIEKTDAQEKVERLQKTVEELSTFKQYYEENMVGKDKEMQEKINHLELQKQKTLAASQEYERQAANARNEVLAAEEKLRKMQEKMDEMGQTLRKEYEESLIKKLMNAEEVFTQKIKSIEEQSQKQVNSIQEHCWGLQEQLVKDYVKKSEVENKLLEVEKLLRELEDLKTTVRSYEDTINSYKVKEREITGVVQEYQNKVETLRTELEQTNQCYSEAVLENTRVSSEKQMLEQEISKVSQKEEELKTQLVEIQEKLSEVSQKYDQQVGAVQKQKSVLELKISELESCNADLHNRLIKAQSGKFSLGMNATLPANMGTGRVTYRRQFSDQQTYSSEDNAEELRSFGFSRPLQANVTAQPFAGEAERAEANSSPDLGIESDHGRFSSLETNANNNVPRPLLQTIELTESMNNLFDEQNIDVETNNPATDHCCQKSVEIAQENNELKRKLLRMKRALEETATQLNLANQRKKQVEKTICKQIHKTSQVLRKAKANLDSGSEGDVFRM